MGTITAQIQLTEAELKLLQTLVYQECGMFFDERRSHFLKDRLQRRLKACQLDSFYGYYRLLTAAKGKPSLLCCLKTSPSTKPVFSATSHSLNSCKRRFSRNSCTANRSDAISLCASGAP